MIDLIGTTWVFNNNNYLNLPDSWPSEEGDCLSVRDVEFLYTYNSSSSFYYGIDIIADLNERTITKVYVYDEFDGDYCVYDSEWLYDDPQFEFFEQPGYIGPEALAEVFYDWLQLNASRLQQDYKTTYDEILSIANAIREKGGTSAGLVYPSGFVNAIQAIQTTPSLQSKSISPTESGQVVTADSAYDGLSSVTVAAIDSSYVGSNVPQRTSTDLSASGSIITVPAGYYASAVEKAVVGGTATTPSKIINVTPTISLNSSTGAVSVDVTGSSNITPIVSAGYISSGIAGTVSVSGSSTFDLTIKAAATYTPSASTQTIAAGVYLTGAQTIEPIPISVDNHRLILPEGLISV